MRQSEGNRTEKTLSAARRNQTRPAETAAGDGLQETILGPATAALLWLARIRSSLLLKTASLLHV